MCSMWAYVGLAKVHCGATPPSVMVLFLWWKEVLSKLKKKRTKFKKCKTFKNLMDSHDVDVEEKLLDESVMTNTAS